MSETITDRALSRPAAVIGAGTLGRRIALMLATRGGHVRIFDNNADTAQAGVDYARAVLPSVVATLPEGVPGQIDSASSLEEVIDEAWLVIEALPERLDLKISVFDTLSQKAASDAILATNSSSFPSSQIAVKVADKTRVLNTHFMMPPKLQAVEFMSCGETRTGLMEELADYFSRLGLSPYIARKESPGFIMNRIWAAIKRESLCVAAEGVATPEVIDKIYCETQGTSVGPFFLMDQVGLDIVLQIEEHYAEIYPELPVAPREFLKKLIEENRLGVKTGRGFYTYDRTGKKI